MCVFDGDEYVVYVCGEEGVFVVGVYVVLLICVWCVSVSVCGICVYSV